ncbi:MAG: hypothetical protein QOH06_3809 [Acidobacteriota bacterium]|nr:hypothetical protein [Acidobacteriota bacterium]
MTGPAPAPRFGQFYFSRKTATAYELYIFGGATAEFAPVLLNDMWRLTIPSQAAADRERFRSSARAASGVLLIAVEDAVLIAIDAGADSRARRSAGVGQLTVFL